MKVLAATNLEKMQRKGCSFFKKTALYPSTLYCEKQRQKHGKNKRFAGFLALISLKGMSKLFSSLESNPRSLEANLKFLLVAASAFIFPFTQFKRMKKANTKFQCF